MGGDTLASLLVLPQEKRHVVTFPSGMSVSNVHAKTNAGKIHSID